MAEVISTLKSSGGDYTSINSWVAATQSGTWATDSDTPVLECYKSAAGLNESVVISGYTDTADGFAPVIRAATGEEHGGIPLAGFYISKNNNYGAALDISTAFTKLQHIEVRNPATSTGRTIIDSIGDLEFLSVIAFNGATTGSNYPHNFRELRSGTKAINCLSLQGGVGFSSKSYDANAPQILNCIAVDAETGFHRAISSEPTIKNSIAFNCTTSFGDGGGIGGWGSSTNNAASDASTNTPEGTSPITTGIVSGDFVDSANDDYHLASGSTLIDAGADLSGTFTDDIDGETRSGTWDVGFDEIVSGGGGTNINANSASLTFTTHAATVNAAKNVNANTASISFTTHAATVSTTTDVNVEANAASLSFTTHQASVNASRNVQAQSASITFTTHAASISVGKQINAGFASLVFTPHPATITYNKNIQANTAAIVFTAHKATVSDGSIPPAEVGAQGFSFGFDDAQGFSGSLGGNNGFTGGL